MVDLDLDFGYLNIVISNRSNRNQTEIGRNTLPRGGIAADKREQARELNVHQHGYLIVGPLATWKS